MAKYSHWLEWANVTVLRTDVTVLHTDVMVLHTDVTVLRTDVTVLCTDVTELRTDVAQLQLWSTSSHLFTTALHFCVMLHVCTHLKSSFIIHWKCSEGLTRERKQTESKMEPFVIQMLFYCDNQPLECMLIWSVMNWGHNGRDSFSWWVPEEGLKVEMDGRSR